MKHRMESYSKLREYMPKTLALLEEHKDTEKGRLISGLIHNAIRRIKRRKVIQLVALKQLDEVLLVQFDESMAMIRKMADEMFDLLTKQKGM